MINPQAQEVGARLEKDFLGECSIPVNSYYGIHTQRAINNFRISGIHLSNFPNLIKALAMIKKAAVLTNGRLGLLEKHIMSSISQACDEIISGQHHTAFVVDMFQGGAGTSTNMNANEVIANRALELLGYARGDYGHIHPCDHVNMSQSTNDVYPTAIRCAILLSHTELTDALERLCDAFHEKSDEFKRVFKLGRTQLQDAVPMTLGQEFDAFRATVSEDIICLRSVVELLKEVNLGGTVIGTRINTHPEYHRHVVRELSQLSGLDLRPAENLIEATSDAGAFVLYSSVLKRVAVKISKISSDLRLLSSGPRGGLNEINLPPVQTGSSIMPGKVNPVIPELVNQVAFHVIGSDLVVTLAAEHGQLQLNAMETVIAFNLLQSTRMLAVTMDTFTEKCIRGITANAKQCRDLLDRSTALVTTLGPHLGYEKAAAIALKVLQSGATVRGFMANENVLSDKQIDDMFNFEKLI